MAKRAYNVKSVHYGQQPQVVNTFRSEDAAVRFQNEQAEILKGYFPRTGMIGGRFIVFGEGDIFQTQIWVERAS